MEAATSPVLVMTRKRIIQTQVTSPALVTAIPLAQNDGIPRPLFMAHLPRPDDKVHFVQSRGRRRMTMTSGLTYQTRWATPLDTNAQPSTDKSFRTFSTSRATSSKRVV